ncbi:Oidioi.mRNA.OKI2018_I69.chr1.g451.t1.cds [Oikopleura dioica]|uniref:Oidioi.mRNA.OKI2018_I69.chr1.g451.t1.cds n=1 Tax=Oikopleura dioica TaxID=34765 RepID=A0ABN7SR67_OIKDI|nr:Oidioi.mRNA.OKI2018_I69.chr1.g451.t1.cds [Oikopleura dioica]
MGFSARLLSDDFRDLVECYFCKLVIEDAVALGCCEEHCCRRCLEKKQERGQECRCGEQVDSLIEDQPKIIELRQLNGFECCQCFTKPLGYDQLSWPGFVPQDEIVKRPKRFGETVSNDFARNKISEKTKFKIGWIADRYGDIIEPKTKTITVNEGDDVMTLRLKIREHSKVDPRWQLFFNGISENKKELINNIDPIKMFDDITTGEDGILWIGRKNHWEE